MTRKGRRLTLIGVALAVVDGEQGKEQAGDFMRHGQRGAGSVQRGADAMTFKITDNDKIVAVDCAGACFANVPDLFREGQGVVAEGTLAAGGRLSAEAILAKVSPETSIIEVGPNTYGHPSPKVVSTW